VIRHRRSRTQLARVAGLDFYDWSKEDFVALSEACRQITCTEEDLLLTIALETGSTFNPAAAFRNASGYPSAIGLNQITSVNASAMGITEAERLSLLDMTPAEQLPYVARSFLAARGFKPFPEPPDAVTLYQTNIAPASVGSEIVYVQKEFPCPPAREAKTAYCANAGLDADKDGQITREDLRVKLNGFRNGANYQIMLAKLQASLESREADGAAGAGAGSGLMIAGALGLGAFAIWGR